MRWMVEYSRKKGRKINALRRKLEITSFKDN